jgi:hypothetical protein
MTVIRTFILNTLGLSLLALVFYIMFMIGAGILDVVVQATSLLLR